MIPPRAFRDPMADPGDERCELCGVAAPCHVLIGSFTIPRGTFRVQLEACRECSRELASGFGASVRACDCATCAARSPERNPGLQ